jgi:hypothetical protein
MCQTERNLSPFSYDIDATERDDCLSGKQLLICKIKVKFYYSLNRANPRYDGLIGAEGLSPMSAVKG